MLLPIHCIWPMQQGWRLNLNSDWEQTGIQCSYKTLATKQKQMKLRFDRQRSTQSFQVGDSVLLAVTISALQARFTKPYSVEQKLSETEYINSTLDRYVKMLKLKERVKAKHV